VDGNGLSKIEDSNIARAILEKVNTMNADTAIQCFTTAGLFAILPQSASAPLVAIALAFATLYALNGKIPKVE
jgi:hypothetical protein